MQPIRDMSTFYKYMHKKVRWGSRGVLMVRGAEIIRGLPSQKVPRLGPGPKSIEAQEHSAQAQAPVATE